MEEIYNPYLPLTEYIPDGEPHVFGDRLYIYGSHDAIGATNYCPGDYEVWSAPITDLKNWRREGISYRKDQDPSNADGRMQLWAPDVTRGPDGRYYLYYCLSFYPEIGVAVSDVPEGPFSFYGHVHYPETIQGGETLREFMPFDPAVLTDQDGRVFLYYGFAPGGEKELTIPDPDSMEIPEEEKEKLKAMAEQLSKTQFGEDCMVAELEPDMLTLKEIPRPLIPGGHHEQGSGFEGHAFFEASSIRRVQEKYYFVYSSYKSHELCYAVSEYPDRDFQYGGTIISNGNIGLHGNAKPSYPLSNNHGGMVQVGDDWYIFYHRATDGTEFSRQGCAEKICIQEDGRIEQVEMTSCGLNGEPLKALGSFPASICCHVSSTDTLDHIDYSNPVMKTQTRVTEQQNVSFVTDIKDDTVIGYKYFIVPEPVRMLLLELRGNFQGRVSIAESSDTEKMEYGTAFLNLASEHWRAVKVPVDMSQKEKTALYLKFCGEGKLDLKTFIFVSSMMDD
ncbi:MAG: family 43 glycosylhydrolase [Parasporobacterium sp.]|nr:family 43 glycosylhydrolase [Parasporobacterium sp.]